MFVGKVPEDAGLTDYLALFPRWLDYFPLAATAPVIGATCLVARPLFPKRPKLRVLLHYQLTAVCG